MARNKRKNNTNTQASDIVEESVEQVETVEEQQPVSEQVETVEEEVVEESVIKEVTNNKIEVTEDVTKLEADLNKALEDYKKHLKNRSTSPVTMQKYYRSIMSVIRSSKDAIESKRMLNTIIAFYKDNAGIGTSGFALFSHMIESKVSEDVDAFCLLQLTFSSLAGNEDSVNANPEQLIHGLNIEGAFASALLTLN